MMEKIRLAASDVGGTLADSTGWISKKTAETVRHLLEQGIYFALISGYNLNTVQRHCNAILDGPSPYLIAVAHNGAIISIGGSILERNFLPAAKAREAIGFFRKHGFSPMAFTGPDHGGAVLQEMAPGVPETGPGHTTVVPDLVSALPSDPVQISVLSDTSRVLEAEAEARRVFRDCHVVVSRGAEKSWLEINHPRANKLDALHTVLAHLGLTVNQTVYFGDNLNDVDILRLVAHPVVVANGLPEVKALSGRTARSNDEDGVAYVLEEMWQEGFFAVDHP